MSGQTEMELMTLKSNEYEMEEPKPKLHVHVCAKTNESNRVFKQIETTNAVNRGEDCSRLFPRSRLLMIIV